jgi:hypothetical protein
MQVFRSAVLQSENFPSIHYGGIFDDYRARIVGIINEIDQKSIPIAILRIFTIFLAHSSFSFRGKGSSASCRVKWGGP